MLNIRLKEMSIQELRELHEALENAILNHKGKKKAVTVRSVVDGIVQEKG